MPGGPGFRLSGGGYLRLILFALLAGSPSRASFAADPCVTPAAPLPTPTPACPFRVFPNPYPEADAKFGNSVAFRGGQIGLIVGAPGATSGGVPDAGQAYQITDGILTPGSVIAHPSPVSGDGFGTSVGVDTNWLSIVIGAPGRDPAGVSDAGESYIFNAYPIGSLRFTLASPSPVPGGRFGTAVDVAFDTALIGAPGELARGVQAFDPFTGVATGLVGPTFRTGGNGIGTALSIDPDAGLILSVGEPYHVPPSCSLDPSGQHAVYEWYGSGVPPLWFAGSGPDPQPGEEFGAAVSSYDRTHVVVGAPGRDADGMEDVGIVYVYDGAAGSLCTTIKNPFPEPGARFGAAVDGDLSAGLLIGAPGAGIGAHEAGAAYLYYYAFDGTSNAALYDTWLNPDPRPGDHFGAAVENLRGSSYIGAPDADVDGFDNAGIVYVFSASFPCASPTPGASPTPAATPTPAPSASPAASASPPPSPSPTPACCRGDANQSGEVSGQDFSAVMAFFGANHPAPGGPGDADCSGGIVDAGDFIAVQANFGADCG